MKTEQIFFYHYFWLVLFLYYMHFMLSLSCVLYAFYWLCCTALALQKRWIGWLEIYFRKRQTPATLVLKNNKTFLSLTVLIISVHKLVPEIPTPYIYYIILFIILYTEKLHTCARTFLFTFCCCLFTSTSTFASEESAAHSKRPFTRLYCKFSSEYWVCSDKTVARMNQMSRDQLGLWSVFPFK